MIRLCSIQPVAERGGSDQALLRMVRSLPSVEFECHVVVPSDPPLRAELEASGTTIHVIPMRRISTSHRVWDWVAYVFGWPRAVARIHRLVRELDIDVVHTNSLHSWYGWAAARLARRPHVWHAREIVVQSGTALRVERFLTRRFATRVVCGSEAIADQLDAHDMVVVYDAPDPRQFSPSRAGRARVALGFPDDLPLVGVVGRIDTWKGIDVALDAWPLVRGHHPGARLAIAGGTVTGKEDYAAGLRRRADGQPDVHWVGELDERAVAELLADLDVLVVPSTEPEPYGLVVVEALMSGTPVIATDRGGPREIAALAAAGSTRLIPPDDVAALGDAIVACLDEHDPTTAQGRTRRQALLVLPAGAMAEIFESVATPR